MKKTVLFGALAIASGLAAASTVPTSTVSVTAWMTPVVLNTLNSTNPPIVFDPASFELVTGAYGANTTFALIDTDPEQRQVTYNLYEDADSNIGAISLGALLGTWSFADALGGAVGGTFSALLSAGQQYVLTIATDGAYSSSTRVSAVPLPGAALLFGTALLGAGAMGRKKLAQKRADAVAA